MKNYGKTKKIMSNNNEDTLELSLKGIKLKGLLLLFILIIG